MPPTDVPPLGFGTYKLTDHDECVESVRHALEIGYRHVDTAQMYRNEEAVGEGLAAADVDRDEVFLASKILPENLAYADVVESTAASLDRLGVDHLDLMYVHWPTKAYDPVETTRGLDEIVDRGYARHVGVSNFTPDLLAEARANLDAPLLANQVEMHPLFQQDELVAEARANDEYVVAYSPIAKGRVFDVPELVDIGEKHGATAAQITLAWHRQRENVAAIPKARGDHIDENYASLDVDLDDEDVRRIESLDVEERIVRPDTGPWTW
ncbi:MAG: aldo/keto reductase [Halobacteriaceae archaeon]